MRVLEELRYPAPHSGLCRVWGEQQNLVRGPRPERERQVRRAPYREDLRPDPHPPKSGLELALRPHGRARAALLAAKQRQLGGHGDRTEELGVSGRGSSVQPGSAAPAGPPRPGEVAPLAGA